MQYGGVPQKENTAVKKGTVFSIEFPCHLQALTCEKCLILIIEILVIQPLAFLTNNI